MVAHDFWAQDLTPDLVVVTYFDGQLADGEEIDIGRLARYFSVPSDWPELFRFDLPRLEQRIELTASWSSAAFAGRRRIKERVLSLFPNYKESTNLANHVLFDHDRAHGAPQKTYATLRRFIARAQQHGTRLCFVAFPSQEGTEISPEARRIILDAGMSLIDLRHIEELRPEHYHDFVHMNESGRDVYTRALARALAAESGL
jgi:hypothetical protein